jgi:CRP-like cAMP-binding protein
VHRTSVGPDAAEKFNEIPLFEGLSLGQRQMIARVADQVTAAEGETVMGEGEPGHEFMVLERGHAEVLVHGERVRIMNAGEFFGEMAVLSDGAPRSAAVVARSDVRAFVFTAHFVHELHERIPELGERIDRTAQERAERDALTGS